MAKCSGPERAGTPKRRFPIVGIGTSAGGVSALKALFGHIPSDSGCAFVVVPHLDPTEQSHMTEILERQTEIPVREAEPDVRIEPNCVYIIPPDRYLTLRGGRTVLSQPTEARGHRRAIDLFFMSLAEDAAERAVCVILSGTGTDGAARMRGSYSSRIAARIFSTISAAIATPCSFFACAAACRITSCNVSQTARTSQSPVISLHSKIFAHPVLVSLFHIMRNDCRATRLPRQPNSYPAKERQAIRQRVL